MIKCMRNECDNEARYIGDTGDLACGLCPLREGRDSIRISDVPKLMAWVRERFPTGDIDTEIPRWRRRDRVYVGVAEMSELHAIIGRRPEPTKGTG